MISVKSQICIKSSLTVPWFIKYSNKYTVHKGTINFIKLGTFLTFFKNVLTGLSTSSELTLFWISTIFLFSSEGLGRIIQNLKNKQYIIENITTFKVKVLRNSHCNWYEQHYQQCVLHSESVQDGVRSSSNDSSTSSTWTPSWHNIPGNSSLRSYKIKRF